jgi:UDP-N-acetylglucosamine 2-epimerase (non-hydrolysing)
LDKEIESNRHIKITQPLGYFEFQKLIKHARLVLTDSGGIQEETTYRQIPCLTLRENTERPVTITEGTNTLVKFEEQEILAHIESITTEPTKKEKSPNFGMDILPSGFLRF